MIEQKGEGFPKFTHEQAVDFCTYALHNNVFESPTAIAGWALNSVDPTRKLSVLVDLYIRDAAKSAYEEIDKYRCVEDDYQPQPDGTGPEGSDGAVRPQAEPAAKRRGRPKKGTTTSTDQKGKKGSARVQACKKVVFRFGNTPVSLVAAGDEILVKENKATSRPALTSY